MKVLVLTLSFGSGHVRAARTVAQELCYQQPGVDVRVCDALQDCRNLFRAGYVWPYWMMVRHAPALWGRFFSARVARPDQGTAPEWAFRWGCFKAFQLIQSFQPDTIVASEVAACEIAVIARRRAMTRARIVNVITDYEAEPIWVKTEVDAYAVADHTVREQLIGWGAPSEKLVTTGIPTDRHFAETRDLLAARARYGIADDGRPVVLLMGGGMGPTRMDRIARRLGESNVPMHVLAIAGHDTRVLRRLRRLGSRPPVSLHALGWVDDIAALMQMASLLVTKPGGLTVVEAAVCGLPIVVFDPIPGPELLNAEGLAATGAGVVTRGVEDTVASVLRLLQDGIARRAMADRSRLEARPAAGAIVARLVLQGTEMGTRRRMIA
jgi:processive 1,2-diacylglycerol beta-glucosyltransferase